MTPQKIKVKLFKYDSLSTNHKKSFESYCKRKLDTSLFDGLKPFEFLFLDKKKRSVMKNFDEVI